MRLVHNLHILFVSKIRFCHRPCCKNSSHCERRMDIVSVSSVLVLIFLIFKLSYYNINLLFIRICFECFNNSIVLSLIGMIEIHNIFFKNLVIFELWTILKNIINALFWSSIFKIKCCLWFEDIGFSCNNKCIVIVCKVKLFENYFIDILCLLVDSIKVLVQVILVLFCLPINRVSYFFHYDEVLYYAIFNIQSQCFIISFFFLQKIIVVCCFNCLDFLIFETFNVLRIHSESFLCVKINCLLNYFQQMILISFSLLLNQVNLSLRLKSNLFIFFVYILFFLHYFWNFSQIVLKIFFKFVKFGVK